MYANMERVSANKPQHTFTSVNYAHLSEAHTHTTRHTRFIRAYVQMIRFRGSFMGLCDKEQPLTVCNSL